MTTADKGRRKDVNSIGRVQLIMLPGDYDNISVIRKHYRYKHNSFAMRRALAEVAAMIKAKSKAKKQSRS